MTIDKFIDMQRNQSMKSTKLHFAFFFGPVKIWPHYETKYGSTIFAPVLMIGFLFLVYFGTIVTPETLINQFKTNLDEWNNRI